MLIIGYRKRSFEGQVIEGVECPSCKGTKHLPRGDKEYLTLGFVLKIPTNSTVNLLCLGCGAIFQESQLTPALTENLKEKLLPKDRFWYVPFLLGAAFVLVYACLAFYSSSYQNSKQNTSNISAEILSENLEVLLEKACLEPGLRPAFYKKLLSSELIVLTQKEASNDKKKDKSQLSIKTDEDGTIPVFTSTERIFDGSNVTIEVPFAGLDGRSLLNITKGATLHINPFSNYQRTLTSYEIEKILDGTYFQSKRVENIKKNERIRLGVPNSIDEGLKRSLIEYSKTRTEIEAVYIGMMDRVGSGEDPNLVVGLKIKAKKKEILNEIGEVLSPYIEEKKPIDVVELTDDSTFAELFENIEAIYSNALKGFVHKNKQDEIIQRTELDDVSSTNFEDVVDPTSSDSINKKSSQAPEEKSDEIANQIHELVTAEDNAIAVSNSVKPEEQGTKVDKTNFEESRIQPEISMDYYFHKPLVEIRHTDHTAKSINKLISYDTTSLVDNIVSLEISAECIISAQGISPQISINLSFRYQFFTNKDNINEVLIGVSASTVTLKSSNTEFKLKIAPDEKGIFDTAGLKTLNVSDNNVANVIETALSSILELKGRADKVNYLLMQGVKEAVTAGSLSIADYCINQGRAIQNYFLNVKDECLVGGSKRFQDSFVKNYLEYLKKNVDNDLFPQKNSTYFFRSIPTFFVPLKDSWRKELNVSDVDVICSKFSNHIIYESDGDIQSQVANLKYGLTVYNREGYPSCFVLSAYYSSFLETAFSAINVFTISSKDKFSDEIKFHADGVVDKFVSSAAENKLTLVGGGDLSFLLFDFFRDLELKKGILYDELVALSNMEFDISSEVLDKIVFDPEKNKEKDKAIDDILKRVKMHIIRKGTTLESFDEQEEVGGAKVIGVGSTIKLIPSEEGVKELDVGGLILFLQVKNYPVDEISLEGFCTLILNNVMIFKHDIIHPLGVFPITDSDLIKTSVEVNNNVKDELAEEIISKLLTLRGRNKVFNTADQVVSEFDVKAIKKILAIGEIQKHIQNDLFSEELLFKLVSTEKDRIFENYPNNVAEKFKSMYDHYEQEFEIDDQYSNNSGICFPVKSSVDSATEDLPFEKVESNSTSSSNIELSYSEDEAKLIAQLKSGLSTYKVRRFLGNPNEKEIFYEGPYSEIWSYGRVKIFFDLENKIVFWEVDMNY